MFHGSHSVYLGGWTYQELSWSWEDIGKEDRGGEILTEGERKKIATEMG
jgi:hypothetical protein